MPRHIGALDGYSKLYREAGWRRGRRLRYVLALDRRPERCLTIKGPGAIRLKHRVRKQRVRRARRRA
jgi:hypothetical protein